MAEPCRAMTTRRSTLAIAGAALVPIGLIALVLAFRARGRGAYREALASADWVARCRSIPPTWRRFARWDSARAGRRWSLKHSSSCRARCRRRSFPVRIGETALLIGERFYRYGFRGIRRGRGRDLARRRRRLPRNQLLHPDADGRAHMMALRIPVPAAAREQGAIAFRHIDAQVSPYQRPRGCGRHSRYPFRGGGAGARRAALAAAAAAGSSAIALWSWRCWRSSRDAALTDAAPMPPRNGKGEIVFCVSLTVSVCPAGGAARWGQRMRGQIAQAGPIGGDMRAGERSRPSA